jgi:hypothetical protein
MCFSKFAEDYTPEEGERVWQGIGSFGKIYNKFAEESGYAPSDGDVKRILTSLGAITDVPLERSYCSFPPCGKALNSHNQSRFCGACQQALIDEEDSTRKSGILSFLRQECPQLFARALEVSPWKLTAV